MGKTNVNMKDIAQSAGVSIATVSRVINGKSVKAETRDSVIKIMEETGYVPNAFARGLAASESRSVGVLISDIADNFFARQLSIVESELRKNGYNTIVACVNVDMPEEVQKRQIQHMLGNHVAGIFFIGPEFNRSTSQKYLNNGNSHIPLILLNDISQFARAYCVGADDTNAVSNVIRKLHERGKRNFIYLYDRINPSGLAKLKGFRQGLDMCEIAFEEKNIFSCARDVLAARDMVRNIIERGAPVDAIVTAQDELAVGALKAVAMSGLSSPRDIAVVGYNNSPFAMSCTPELSSIDNNVQSLSEIAVKTFLDVMEKKKVPKHILISCNFIERGTT